MNWHRLRRARRISDARELSWLIRGDMWRLREFEEAWPGQLDQLQRQLFELSERAFDAYIREDDSDAQTVLQEWITVRGLLFRRSRRRRYELAGCARSAGMNTQISTENGERR